MPSPCSVAAHLFIPGVINHDNVRASFPHVSAHRPSAPRSPSRTLSHRPVVDSSLPSVKISFNCYLALIYSILLSVMYWYEGENPRKMITKRPTS